MKWVKDGLQRYLSLLEGHAGRVRGARSRVLPRRHPRESLFNDPRCFIRVRNEERRRSEALL